MGNRQKKLVPTRQEANLTRVDPTPTANQAQDATINLPDELVQANLHKIDPTLQISTYSRLAEWKRIKSSATPFPACYDAVLFTDQTTLFVFPGSTERGTKSHKQYFGYDFENKSWYVIDLEEALPAISMALRVSDTIYFFSTKKMLTYSLTTHKIIESPLPFEGTKQLFSAHHVNGDIYLFWGDNDTTDFEKIAVYNIESQQWSTKITSNTIRPLDRSGFATTVVGDDIYMYAGFHSGYIHDLWRLDTITLTWHEVQATGTPVGCAGHSMSSLYIYNQLYLVAFGGYNGHYLNTTQFFNLNTLEWETFTCKPANTETTIGPRTGASALVINNNLYIVGGYNGPYYNDAYVLKPRALSLKLLCFEYLHKNAKNFNDLSEKLPTDLYEEFRRFV